MGAAFFYHLTQAPLEAVLPTLIEKALGNGWRVAVRGRDAAMLDRLDRVLWGGAESFLPHGLAGGPHDADQPVLLTTAAEMPNGARCLMAVDSAEVTAEEALALDRACILFDGDDPGALEAARAQWRTLTAAGVPAEYWAQGAGGWKRQATSARA